MRIGVLLSSLTLVLTTWLAFHSVPVAALVGPGCDSLHERNCSVVEPPPAPAPPPPPAPGPGGGGGSDSGDSGGGGGNGGGSPGGGGGSDGGGQPDCIFEEVGHICADLPGPGGDGGGGGAPVRPEPPTRIPESQFQTFDIPAPTIHAWPKDWAVIGKPAAFWTDADTSYIDMTLLTYAVTVKVTPEKYYWDFGDDTGGTTSKTGSKPRPGDEPQIGHDYQKTGAKTVGMTATFSGEFSVDGGPWLPIDGFAHVASNEISIDVYRFHRYLVDGDCYMNPQGPDCN